MRKIQALFFFGGGEVELHAQGFKTGCNNFENICVAQCGIVEPGSVDQNDTMFAHKERLGALDLVRARYLPIVHPEIGFAGEIYELFEPWRAGGRDRVSSFGNAQPRNIHTVDFPAPVGPITL